MNNQKGITIVSLVIYVVAMSIVLIVINSIITTFYNNTESTDQIVQEIIEFNKFNTYFLKEVKTKENKVDQIGQDKQNSYILFSSGNSFMFKVNKIYYNDLEICNNIKSINFECKKNIDENGNERYEDIIKVTVIFENFTETISYRIENIY